MKYIRTFVVMLALVLLLQSASVGMAAGSADQGRSAGKPYVIWFDEAAPETVEGFECWSLPLGNGYMGVNVFGGVESELISVTENSLFNPGSGEKGTLDSATGIYYNDFGDQRIDAASGGLNLMAKTYIDFDHATEDATSYKRELSLNESVAKVSYVQNGVTYTREYFTSYPDKVMVMRLTASEAGQLSFTLRPEIPFCYDPDVDPVKYSYLDEPGDGMYKTGKVTAEGDTITLKGTMEYFGTDFEGLYKVIPTGGSMSAANDANGKNGTITVTDADSAIIIMAAGTNYEYDYVTFDKAKGMLSGAPDPHEKVQGWLDAAVAKSYDELLANHQADYKELYERSTIDLGGVYNASMTTDQLLKNYQNGTNDAYLEEIAFQFGRYLLICSSREGCLPANLQGIWNFADSAAWSGGYWHNINVQMNYWPAFNTGLAELFQSYVDYNEAMRDQSEANADTFLKTIKAPGIAVAGTGENGYTIGTGCNPYYTATASTTGHSGPGTVAFTSLLFWDWYEYTQDEEILEDHVYPAVEGAAKFLSKTVKEYEDGTYLVYNSASPENISGRDPVTDKQLYIRTVGTAFDQQMVYANHLATVQAAEILGYTEETYPILATLNEQLDKLDPVKIGYSGQVKEYREENYYGEIGEKQHRHISQLVGVYPASIINSSTDAWLEAAAVSLENRGHTNIAWGVVHRMLCWARIKDSEQAYNAVQLMMKEHLGNNLFSNYNNHTQQKAANNPFQIEANFGYTAAVAEVLVQSQSGYLEFLPALPEQWANGSFQGLTTRGNFAVDATWENGVATSFVIESGSGKDCSVKYPNIANAVVKDSQGNTIAFTAEGADLISFSTTEGERYTISSIPSHTAGLSAPESLSLSATGNSMSLNWTAVSGAASYNVYRALNDAATYELVASNVSGTSYAYAHTDIKGSDRVTMRVTAVAADGTESRGVLAYSLPLSTFEEVTGYIFDGTDLQLEYEPVETATEYRVYANGELVATSKYAVAVVKNADPTATYSVSIVSDGRESAATVATIQQASNQDNILLGKELTLEGRDYWISSNPGSLAVNGNTATNNSSDRWAVSDKVTPYSVTVDLDGTYKLGTLTIYEWKSSSATTRSDKTTVEVLNRDGQWQTVKSGFALSHGGSVAVDMGGVEASQIRFTFENTDEGKSACIAEITCTGEALEAVNKIELLEALESYGDQDVAANSFAGVPVAYIVAEREAKALIADTAATQVAVDKAAIALKKAATKVNIFKGATAESSLKFIGSYNPNNMLDGVTSDSSRWAVSPGANADNSEDTADVTVTLGGLYHLEGVFVQEFLMSGQMTEGGEVTIEVSSDGSQWTTVISGVSLQEYRDGVMHESASSSAFVFDNSVLASKVRFTFYDKHNHMSAKAITIFELQAYGEKVEEGKLSISSSMLTLASGKTHALTASGTVSSWTSSNVDVVTVDSTGKITAINRGKATVTATDGSGNSVSCDVTVLCDTAALEEAISQAKEALEGVRGIDRTADRVISGTRFVSTLRLTALEAAISQAERSMTTATSADKMSGAVSAISGELARFQADLKTGTMNITEHSHCVCTGVLDHTCTAVTWTAWGDDEAERTSLPVATGNYFLVDDITISKNYNIGSDNPSVMVSLCLNGFNVEATHTSEHAYNVYSVLNVCDCAAEENWGSIIGNVTGTDSVGAAIQLRDNRLNKGTLNLYSGIITAKETAVVKQGGLIMIGNTGENGSVLNMYGGKLCGGRAQQGGAVAVRGCGSFNMYGGTVSDNYADSGAVAVILDFGNPGAKINVYGGTMGASKNLSGAAVSDFAIFDAAGVLQISGGTFVDGLSVEDTTLKDSLAENVVIVKSADGSVVAVDDTGTSTGSVTVEVRSGAFTAESASLALSTYEVEYDGRNDTPVPEALVKFGATTLVKDTHYTISYQRNGAATTDLHSPGQITMVITGVAPYSGTLTATYTVLDCSKVDKSVLEAAIASYGNLDAGAASFAGTPLAYEKAKQIANTVLANEDASAEEVAAAVKNLIDSATKDNIFHNRPIASDRVAFSTYVLENMVDENNATRYVMNKLASGQDGSTISFTVTLDGLYSLEAVFSQEFLNKTETASRAKFVKVEAFVDGRWTTVVAETAPAGKPDTNSTTSEVTALILEQPVVTNQVRVTYTHVTTTYTSNAKLMTIRELQAYGTKINREVLEEALEQYGDLNTGAASFAGTPLAYEKAVKDANAVLADEAATQAQIDAAAANLINAATKDNIFYGMQVDCDKRTINGYGPDQMVDEDNATRVALGTQTAPTVSFVVNLDAVYELEAVFFNEYLDLNEVVSRAKSVMLEVYLDGVWTTVIAEGIPAGKPDTTTKISEVTAFILEQPVLASKVRVTYAHVTTDFSTNRKLLTIYELQAYGEKVRPLTDESLAFSGASVTLYSDLSVNFKVSEALFDEGGFTDPYVVFSFGGNETEATAYRISDGKMTFRFDKIAPHQIGETITATLYATKNGVVYGSKSVTYSVEQYCQRTLNRYNSDVYAELRTLLVDLLNYGAAAQLYVNPDTAEVDLVNSWLTEQQAAWGSSGAVEVSDSVAGEEQTLGATPTVTCHGVGLTLADSVAIRFKLKADSTEGLAVKFTANGKTYEVTEFKPVTGEAGYYYVYFRNLNASQLRSTVKAVVYQNGVAVSNTFCYSVECYVANNMADSNEALAALVTAVIRYGDAAAAYVN